MMKIRIAHSPDSDDAFMFYGLASGKVPSRGYELEHVLSDIETLNRAAFDGHVRNHGRVVSRLRAPDRSLHPAAARRQHGRPLRPDRRRRRRRPRRSTACASRFPATLTTAFLTLRLFDPAVEYVVMPFDQIQEAVHGGEAQAGLLIHEGQLTYADEGLKKIVDLGEWWADRTGGLPLPLGGNVIRRDLGPALIATVVAHAARQHRVRRSITATRRSSTRMQFGRGLDRSEDRRVRRDVRERAHARLRRARPARPCGAC